MVHYLFCLILLLPQYAQSQLTSLDCLRDISDYQWHAEGTWGDGSPFEQTISFEYSLDSQVIHVRTLGFVDNEQTLIGHRNQGIRVYDATIGKVKFWEFDVFGGITEGTMTCEGKDIVYTYNYGGTVVTDMWSYINDSTYHFTVGSRKNVEWSQKYLETEFHSHVVSDAEKALQLLEDRIVGEWTSTAWDGELHEDWKLGANGEIWQDAIYVEEDVVLYEATNKIEVVNNELILSTIVKGGNPKIFKASLILDDEIVFENSDYNHPSKVVYKFVDDNRFIRTISGQEQGQARSHTFQFERN